MVDESEDTYIIPAPVLANNDKIDLGFISFTLIQLFELGGLIGFIYLLWSLLSFILPWFVLLSGSLSLLIIGVIFITQPVYGLPGDKWLWYAFRFYVLERKKHALSKQGRRYLKVTTFRLLDEQGTPLISYEERGHS